MLSPVELTVGEACELERRAKRGERLTADEVEQLEAVRAWVRPQLAPVAPVARAAADAVASLAQGAEWMRRAIPDPAAADELVDRFDADPRLARRYGDAPIRDARLILRALNGASRSRVAPRARAPRSRRSRAVGRSTGSRSGDDPPPEPDPLRVVSPPAFREDVARGLVGGAA
jgi:hypothetical protein